MSLPSVSLLAALLLPAIGAAAPIAAPRVLAIDTSGSQSADFALPATPLVAPVRQLRLRFDQGLAPMHAALPGVALPVDGFRLLAAGSDGVVQTTACAGPALGDDADVALASLQWHAASREATLTLDGDLALAVGRYVVLACDSLLGLTGLALDGDGDGAPGGNARFAVATVESPQLPNPTLDADVSSWSLDVLGAPPAYDVRDADDAPHSGSLRISGNALGRRLFSSACIRLDEVPPGGFRPTLDYRVRYRARVLSGTVRIHADVWTGFSGDLGESGCVGPGLWTRHFGALRSAGESFEVYDTGLQRAAASLPLAHLTLAVVSGDGQPFELLLDDIGFGFDRDGIFRSNFD